MFRNILFIAIACAFALASCNQTTGSSTTTETTAHSHDGCSDPGHNHAPAAKQESFTVDADSLKTDKEHTQGGSCCDH